MIKILSIMVVFLSIMARRIEQHSKPTNTMDNNKSLALANAKKAEMLAAGIPVERLSPIEKALRNPTSLRLAINGKCWDCCGAGADGIAFTKETIRQCMVRDCTLRPVRPYQ